MNRGYVVFLGTPPWDNGKPYFRAWDNTYALTSLESPDGMQPEQLYKGIVSGPDGEHEHIFRIEMPLAEYTERCREYAAEIRKGTPAQS